METRNILRGQIYWCDFGNNKLRGEQMNCRPCLIISNESCNKFSPAVIVAPITSKTNKLDKIPVHVAIDNCGLRTESVVLLEQIITVSKERLGNYIGCIKDELTMKRIDNKIKVSLGNIVKPINKLKDNLREEIERQLKDIYAYEDVIRTTKNNIIVNELLKERESLLIELDKYCSDNGYEYKMFYEDYKTRIC